LDIDELDIVSSKEEKQDALIVETNMMLERNNPTLDLQIAPFTKIHNFNAKQRLVLQVCICGMQILLLAKVPIIICM
jgi:hypothetical protein